MKTSTSLIQLEKIGALITNSHIIYTSGKHGASYVNKDAIYPHTELTSELCLDLAKRFQNEKVDVCLAPALGGIILSQWVAFHLTKLTGHEVLGVYAEKGLDGESFVVKRGYDKLSQNRRVLILEDILTTGISVRRVVEVVRAIPATIVGVGALCNRGNVTPEILGGVQRLESLFEVNLESWDAENCPLCKAKVPFNTDVGKARKLSI